MISLSISSRSVVVMIVFMLTISVISNAQTSTVKLSNLKVTRFSDSDVGQINNLFIEFEINNPTELKSLELQFESKTSPGDIQSHRYELIVKEGKAYMVFDKYEQQVEQIVQLMIPVRDQLKSPFHLLTVIGTDNEKKSTNKLTIEFNF